MSRKYVNDKIEQVTAVKEVDRIDKMKRKERRNNQTMARELKSFPDGKFKTRD